MLESVIFWGAVSLVEPRSDIERVGSRACQDCSVGTTVSAVIVVNSTTFIENCEDIVSADGAASANSALVMHNSSYDAGSSCPPHDGLHESFVTVEIIPGSPDSGVMVNKFLQVGSAVKTGSTECAASGSFTADLRGVVGFPCRVEMSSSSCVFLSDYYHFSSIDGYNSGRSSYIEHASGSVDAGVVIELAEPLEAETEISVFASTEFNPGNDCATSLGPTHFDADVVGVQGVGEDITVEIIHVPSGEAVVHRGVVGVDRDGLLHPLGFINSAGISVVSTPTGYSMSGVVSVPSALSAGGSYEINTISRSFGRVVGDYNMSGAVDFNDYYAIDLALATSIGDTDYLASMEVDFNGSISTSEFSRAERLLDIILCPADWDASGSLTVFDINAFVAAYSSSDPSADWDRNGVLNFFDTTAYIDDYNAGCP